MKKLLFALIMCSATVAAFAQDSASQKPVTQYQDDNDKDMQAVATSDLPAPITASLQGQDYSGWTVSNAFQKEKDGKTIYKVELKNGAETKTVKFDADGNLMEEKDK